MKQTTLIHVVQHLVPGGIETMVLDFLRLAKSDETVWLVSMEGDVDTAIKQWPRLADHKERLIFLQKKPGWHLASFWRLFSLFKRLKPDVVQTHHIGPLVYAGNMARLAGVKALIHTEHDAWHLQNPKRRKLQQLAMRFSQPMMVADADEVATNLKKFIPNVKPEIIPNGIDCERFVPADKNQARTHYSLPHNKQLIGTAGRLEAVKAQDVLINALKHLPDTVHLTIAGQGSKERALKYQVKALDLEARVHFLGLIDDMPRFYQSLDVFCLPSLNEGLPLSLLEAQSCDVPAVASDAGGIAEAVCKDSGLLVPPSNEQALVEALEKVLKRQQSPQALSPRKFVLKAGDIKTMHDKYRALWQ